ncbi:MAG: DUF4391 domain-containing protein [Akkermansiaceae bacterium]|jgi:hypothetical protein
MIDLPETWRVESNGKRLNLKSFTPATLPTAQRSRLRNILRKATLTHQFTGTEIPSLITEDYRCQAILFLDIELTELRHADFAARSIQPQIKEHAVLRLHDDSGRFTLSFAHKRLSLTEENAVVVTDSYCTETQATTAALAPLRHTALINRLNKRDHYLEAMAKAFLLDHPKIFIGSPRLFETKLWFHGPTILTLFRALTELESLKTKKDRARTLADKAALNTTIKTSIERIKKDFLPVSELDSCETVKP